MDASSDSSWLGGVLQAGIATAGYKVPSFKAGWDRQPGRLADRIHYSGTNDALRGTLLGPDCPKFSRPRKLSDDDLDLIFSRPRK